ncbi:MAG: DNA polymerase III subunit delta [Planctomycetes bacterium]|nr:DNA polymerase III subunit delta [Planctomycetota bacterium]
MASKESTRASTREKGLTFRALMARKAWTPLPPIAVLTGDAELFKQDVLRRFTRELFGDAQPEVRRFQGPTAERQGEELALATVLDELRTPSFFSAYRIVVIERANAFLAANSESFIPFLDKGFSGGHLIAFLDGKLDGRTRFARAMAEKGWIVECAQPYDRPPPWDSEAPPWDSELTHWLVSHARTKGLELDPQTAFLLHERAGTDLAILDEELGKIGTYLAARSSRRVDAEAIAAIVGDLREDSVFHAMELFLAGRAEALEATSRLFRKGYHTERGALTTEPTSIALLFIGALVPRLKALRRAHALAAEGAGPDQWIAAGIVQRPFIARFQRELAAVPPRRLVRLLDRLYEIDRSIKSGGDPEVLLEILVAELGGR